MDNLIAVYPTDQKLKVLLVKQQLALGDLFKAISNILPFVAEHPKTSTDWEALLTYYQIIKINTFKNKTT